MHKYNFHLGFSGCVLDSNDLNLNSGEYIMLILKCTNMTIKYIRNNYFIGHLEMPKKGKCEPFPKVPFA